MFKHFVVTKQTKAWIVPFRYKKNVNFFLGWDFNFYGGIEIHWDLSNKKYSKWTATAMVLIMIYDSHIQIFSKRIPSYASFNRIWISLRFIYIEIYFSKGTYIQNHGNQHKIWPHWWMQNDGAKSEDWPSHPHILNYNISDKHIESILNQRKEIQKFVYIMASSVISIKATNISNERASFTLVDFIWFSCSSYFITFVAFFYTTSENFWIEDIFFNDSNTSIDL